MLGKLNALRWSGAPGHYEVYYLTLTDPLTGVGAWIRYTMLAPLPESGEAASCALWLAMMDPRDGAAPVRARKATFDLEQMSVRSDPFELRIAGAVLSDERMSGAFEDVAWDLRWAPSRAGYEHVHPILRRLA